GALRQLDIAALGNEFAFDQPEQRRFADAVAPDQADLGAGRNRDARRIEKAPSPGVEDEIIDPKHCVPLAPPFAWAMRLARGAPGVKVFALASGAESFEPIIEPRVR